MRRPGDEIVDQSLGITRAPCLVELRDLPEDQPTRSLTHTPQSTIYPA